MSYSVSVPCRDKETRDLMLKFLTSRMNPLKWAGQLRPELHFETRKIILGFNYSSCIPSEERHYIYSLCQFMALRVGRLYRDKALDGSFPCYVYDGNEIVPVLDKTLWKEVTGKYKYFLCDRSGWNGSDPEYLAPSWVHEELNKLSQAWRKFAIRHNIPIMSED